MAQSLATLIRRLFWFLLAAALVFFSVNNRQAVTISLEPFGVLAQPVPLFLILFLGIFIGLIVAGSVTGWLRLKGFARRRQVERRADYLEGQVSVMAEEAHKAHASAAHDATRAATESLPMGPKGR